MRGSTRHRRPGLPAGRAVLGFLAVALLACSSAAQDHEDHLTLVERLGGEVAREIVEELDLPTGSNIHLVPETDHRANWLFEFILAKELRRRGYSVERPALQSVSSPVARPPVPTGAVGGKEAGLPALPIGGSKPVDTLIGEPDAEDDDIFAEDREPSEEDEEAGREGTDDETLGEPGDRKEDADQAADDDAQPADGDAAAGGPATQPATGELPAVAAEVTLPESGEVLLYRVVEFGVSYPWAKRSWLIGPRSYGRIASVRVRATHISEPGHRVADVAESDRVSFDEFPGWVRPYLEGQGYPFPIMQPPTTSVHRIIEPVLVAAIVAGLVYLFYENQK